MGIMSFSRFQVFDRLESGKINVCVVGLGRVGLPTAAVFAESGAKVIGADIDSQVVEIVNSGKPRFDDEPGLDELIKKVVKRGNLRATTSICEAVKASEVSIICVPAPVDEQKVPDYTAIKKACTEIAKEMRKESLIIVEMRARGVK